MRERERSFFRESARPSGFLGVYHCNQNKHVFLFKIGNCMYYMCISRLFNTFRICSIDHRQPPKINDRKCQRNDHCTLTNTNATLQNAESERERRSCIFKQTQNVPLASSHLGESIISDVANLIQFIVHKTSQQTSVTGI